MAFVGLWQPMGFSGGLLGLHSGDYAWLRGRFCRAESECGWLLKFYVEIRRNAG